MPDGAEGFASVRWMARRIKINVKNGAEEFLHRFKQLILTKHRGELKSTPHSVRMALHAALQDSWGGKGGLRRPVVAR